MKLSRGVSLYFKRQPCLIRRWTHQTNSERGTRFVIRGDTNHLCDQFLMLVLYITCPQWVSATSCGLSKDVVHHTRPWNLTLRTNSASTVHIFIDQEQTHFSPYGTSSSSLAETGGGGGMLSYNNCSVCAICYKRKHNFDLDDLANHAHGIGAYFKLLEIAIRSLFHNGRPELMVNIIFTIIQEDVLPISTLTNWWRLSRPFYRYWDAHFVTTTA
jgi:hypothetical protein